MVETALLGLGLVVIAWIIQLVYSWKGSKEIKNRFLVIYAVGIALLVIDGYRTGMKSVAIFNLISLVIAMIIFIRVSSKKGSRTTKTSPAKRKKR